MKCEPFFWPLRQGPWRTGRQVRDKSGHDEKANRPSKGVFSEKIAEASETDACEG